MKKEKVLRIIFWVLVGMAGTSLIILVSTGGATIFDYFVMGLLCCNILVKVIQYIVARVRYYTTFIKYKKIFAYVKYIHKTRYQHYLNGDMEEVKRYQGMMDMCTTTLLTTARTIMNDEVAWKNERKEIQTIIDKTKEMVSNPRASV